MNQSLEELGRLHRVARSSSRLGIPTDGTTLSRFVRRVGVVNAFDILSVDVVKRALRGRESAPAPHAWGGLAHLSTKVVVEGADSDGVLEDLRASQ